jgi:sialic acid synthase SpsE
MDTVGVLPDRSVVQATPWVITAEVAQAHDGSLGMAHAYIDAIAAGGTDAVKFQTHIAAAESTPSEPWRVKFSQQDATSSSPRLSPHPLRDFRDSGEEPA